MQNNDMVTLWLDQAGRKAVLTKEQMIYLARRRDTLEPDSKAYIKIINKICEHNLRLIPIVVKRYMRRRACPEHRDYMADMLQLGYLGLRRAAEKFDPAKGYAFSTYAVPWIKQSVYRGQQHIENMIYIPESIQTEINYVARHGQRSSSKNGVVSQACLDQGKFALKLRSIDVPEVGNHTSDSSPRMICDGLSEENKILNQHYDFSDRRDEVVELFRRAGVSEKHIEVVLLYLDSGRMKTVASRAQIEYSQCRRIYNGAIEKLKTLA